MKLRLVATVIRPERAELLDQLVPVQRGRREVRDWTSQDASTPAGLPFHVRVFSGGELAQLYVLSGETRLLRIDGLRGPFAAAWLALPTGEELELTMRFE